MRTNPYLSPAIPSHPQVGWRISHISANRISVDVSANMSVATCTVYIVISHPRHPLPSLPSQAIPSHPQPSPAGPPNDRLLPPKQASELAMRLAGPARGLLTGGNPW